MLYSVWNPTAKRYDYYQTSTAQAATHATAPPKALFANELGASPDQGAWSLPMGAKLIGSGELARGRVASKGGVLAMGDLPVPQLGTASWILIGLGAYLWWRNRR